ncbi:MAG: prepilin-type N-terminal cleavage/methylation domain-containing protein [Verrucomicrobia bacterium]|nr:prepilin-type N-terminal cleavage/methylation domain-containing protein [Verrucomicrobiota bacterium]
MAVHVQHRGDAFTLVEVMIVVAIVGLLVAIAVPNFVKTRASAQQKACIKNLSTIDSAKQQWGLDNQKTDTDVPVQTDLVGPALYLKDMPVCPGGGTYSFNAIGLRPTCTLASAGHTI